MTTTWQANRLVLASLDAELNVRWKRYFLNPNMFHWGTCMTVMRDGKVAVGSYKYGQNPGGISVVVIQDDGWVVNDRESCIRPYNYYPNPAQDRLHLQYSPDVRPTKIELYDLQGCIVRLQNHSLESVEMQGIAAGQYLMKVTLENGKVFTDKVVKE